MFINLNVLYFLFGIFTGVAVIYTIKWYEKIEPAYGVLKVPMVCLLLVLSVAGFYAASIHSGVILRDVVSLCFLALCIWLLLTTSYMDQRCGSFSVLPVYIALALETVLYLFSTAMGYIQLSGKWVLLILCVQAVLLLMSMVRAYTVGDLLLLYVLQYMYFAVRPSCYIVAVFITVFAAMLFSIMGVLCCMVYSRKRVAHFRPFTMYIAMGMYVAIFLCL